MVAGILARAITHQIKPLKFLKPVADKAFGILNTLVIWVILPTVVFVSISRYSLIELAIMGNAFVMAFFTMGVCFVASVAVSRICGDDRKTMVAISLNSAFQNVTFLGLPVIYAFFDVRGLNGLGPAALYAIGISVPHLVLGVMLAATAVRKKITVGSVIENIITFPAAFALIVALLFVAFSAPLPTVAREFFDAYLTKPFFGLMLLLVGYQMPIASPRKYVKDITMVSLMRFIIGPLVTYGLILALGLSLQTDITPRPSLVQSIMPPGFFNMMLAWNYKLDLKMYSAIIFYTTLLSLFIVLPITYMLIF
ncbi:MAG: AEC family transporter [Candidatus Hadarchaeum sp.]|uniref:AEC family transporter n=1 Tax=Candidatus Hadarchaeum sp. TaxID=2883567 RepID=UPI003179F3C3